MMLRREWSPVTKKSSPALNNQAKITGRTTLISLPWADFKLVSSMMHKHPYEANFQASYVHPSEHSEKHNLTHIADTSVTGLI
jgi:hypothetical protein